MDEYMSARAQTIENVNGIPYWNAISIDLTTD